MSVIDTYSGQKIDLLHPTQSDISLIDIAHGLAHMGRFVGQGTDYYSVGLHSINVSNHLKDLGESPKLQLYGILHDSSEAYLGDIPGTLKSELSDYQNIEAQFMKVIWGWSGLGQPTPTEYQTLSNVDKKIFEHEAAEFLSSYESDTDGDIDIRLYGSSEFEQITDTYIDKAQQLSAQINDAEIPTSLE